MKHHIIKNVLPDTEMPKIRKLFGSCRAKGRGPRVGRAQHQSLPMELATKATLYYGSGWCARGDCLTYAITGWKGNKPIMRPLATPDANPNQPYYKRRKTK